MMLMSISEKELLKIELMGMWTKGVFDSRKLMIRTLEQTVEEVGDITVNLSQIVDLIKSLDFEKLKYEGE